MSKVNNFIPLSMTLWGQFDFGLLIDIKLVWFWSIKSEVGLIWSIKNGVPQNLFSYVSQKLCRTKLFIFKVPGPNPKLLNLKDQNRSTPNFRNKKYNLPCYIYSVKKKGKKKGYKFSFGALGFFVCNKNSCVEKHINQCWVA